MRALCTIIVALALVAPARAADVITPRLDTTVEDLIAGPDGGAWVSVGARDGDRIQRVMPDGTLRTAGDGMPVNDLLLGPDNQAWALTGISIERVDTAGKASTVSIDAFTNAAATGPDGTAWMQTQDGQLTRIAPDGKSTSAPFPVPGCEELRVASLARAADNAMWFFTFDCGVVRLAPGGAATVIAPLQLMEVELAPDPVGGMWFTSGDQSGHVDAAGGVTRLQGIGRAADVDVAADGSAWFTTRTCALARANPDGTVTRVPTSIPTWQLAFAPDGSLWLASPARLQHTAIGAPATGCDDTPPKVKVTPNPAKRVRLATLLRRRELTVTVREPAVISGYITGSGDAQLASPRTIVTARKGRTVRIKLDATELRRFARTKRLQLRVGLDVRDLEGNYTSISTVLKVKR